MTGSVGMSIWRFVRNSILGLIAIAIVVGLGFWVVQLRYDHQVSKVKVSIISLGCVEDPMKPLTVRVDNGSSWTVNSVYFVISARTPGFSTDHVASGGREWDKIIRPGEGWLYCTAYPELKSEQSYLGSQTTTVAKKSDLEWSVRLIHLTFAE